MIAAAAVRRTALALGCNHIENGDVKPYRLVVFAVAASVFLCGQFARESGPRRARLSSTQAAGSRPAKAEPAASDAIRGLRVSYNRRVEQHRTEAVAIRRLFLRRAGRVHRATGEIAEGLSVGSFAGAQKLLLVSLCGTACCVAGDVC